MATYFRWNPGRGSDSTYGGSIQGKFLRLGTKPTRGTVTSLYYKADDPGSGNVNLIYANPENSRTKKLKVRTSTALRDLNRFFNHIGKRNHCLEDWIVMRAGSTVYALPEGGCIHQESSGGKTTTPVSRRGMVSRGNLTLNEGDTVWATKGTDPRGKRAPLHLMRDNDTGNVVPKSLAGTRFGFYSNRYGGSRIIIYAFRACKVQVVDDVSDNGFDAATTQSTYTFTAGQIQTISVSTETTNVLISASDDILVSVSESGGGDRMMVPPASRYTFVRRQSSGSVFSSGGNRSNDTKYRVYYGTNAEDRVWATEIGDGAGGDSTCGLGIEHLANRFTYGTTLSDYAIIAPFGDTNVTVKYHDLSHSSAQWKTLRTHTLTGGTPTVPNAIFVDGNGNVTNNHSNYNDSGSAPELGNGASMWWIESTKPIHVVINTPSSDEETLLGWMGRNTRSRSWLSSVSDLENYIVSPDDDYIMVKS